MRGNRGLAIHVRERVWVGTVTDEISSRNFYRNFWLSVAFVVT